MSTNWNRKDLLGLRELSADEINFILETADAFKQVGTREVKKVPALRGKTLVNFFVEPSTRTRTSFELAAFRLSADVINISAAGSSLTKGETLKDTARNLEALHADILVLRHSSAGAAYRRRTGAIITASRGKDRREDRFGVGARLCRSTVGGRAQHRASGSASSGGRSSVSDCADSAAERVGLR